MADTINNMISDNISLNSNLNESLYETMCAYRIVLEEEYNNELLIIKELKKYLYSSGIAVNSINQTIFDFYNYYGIDISLETIENILVLQLNMMNILNNIFNQNENPQEAPQEAPQETPQETSSYNHSEISQDNQTEIFQENNNQYTDFIEYNNLRNLFTSLIQVNTENTENIINPEFQDVVVSLDEEALKNLINKKLQDNLNIKCSICLSQLKKDEYIIELTCSHKYHKECIIHYLQKYNHKCPICRDELGTKKYNI